MERTAFYFRFTSINFRFFFRIGFMMKTLRKPDKTRCVKGTPVLKSACLFYSIRHMRGGAKLRRATKGRCRRVIDTHSGAEVRRAVWNDDGTRAADQYWRTTAVTFPRMAASWPSTGLYASFSGRSQTCPLRRLSRFTVASSPSRATTISPLWASGC